MSALIHHFVVHRLVVNNEDKIEAIPRDNCLAVTPEIELLAHQINHSFNAKPGKGVGHFVLQSNEENTDNVAEFSEGLKKLPSAEKRAATI